MKRRVKRLYRVRAEYGAGYYVTRDYQSEQAARERAARMLDGRPSGHLHVDDEGAPSAVRVTIAVSEPVIFGPPTEYHPDPTEGESP